MVAAAPWEADPPVESAPQASPQAAPASSAAPWASDAPATPPSAPAASSAPADASATTSEPVSGFTDEQKQQILDYLPKATDAADLERYSSELTNGRSHIGNAKDVIAAYQKGHRQFGWMRPVTEAPKPAAPPTVQDTIRESVIDGLDTLAPGIGTFLRSDAAKALLANTADSLVGDYGPEAAGVIDSILHGGKYENNVAHERALLEGESQGHGVASTIGQLAGAVTTGALGNEAGLTADLPRLVRGGVAATEGAIYGSGSAGPDHRIAGAVTGAALGAGTDAVMPLLIKAGASKLAGRTANQEFADAAGRQGVDYMAADLPSATKSKFATALASLSFGGIPLADQGAANVGTAAAAANRVANNIGTVADSTGAGQAAQRGAKSFIDTTAKKMGDLYDAIPIADNAPAVVTNTRSALSSLMSSFRSNPKLAAAFKNPQIAAYMDALTPQTTKEATGLVDAAGNPITRDVTHGGGLSWDDLKDFRTRIGQIIGQPSLTSDGVQMGQLRSLYGALSSDMEATAAQAGPQASRAFQRANTYARARSDRIDNVVSLILGNDQNKAPQTAFEALQRLGKEKGGDAIKLGQALRSMPDDEANTVRATILDSLGDDTAGRQDAHGTVFNPSLFLTNWNKISDRAKNVLFTGEHRQALNDLATVFSGMKSSQRFANGSKTGLYVAAAHTASLSFAHPVLGALDVALQYGGGKLLASPAFARKVASTPKNLAGARAFWSRPWVDQMATKNPAIAGEIKAFQSAFLSHANDNSGVVSAASAEPGQDDQQQ